MPRVTDIDALMEQVKRSERNNPYAGAPMLGTMAATWRVAHKHFRTIVQDAAVVDAVPVVRCRECEHYQPEPYGDVMMCCGFANGQYTKPDDYCSCGKRTQKA